MTKPNVDIEMLRRDSENLSAEDFQKKYPGIKIDTVHDLSDADLDKVAGGVCTCTGGDTSAPNGAGLTYYTGK